MMTLKGYSIDKDVIVIQRELTELDRFVRDFLHALNSDYLVVSGFVSIATGRTRGTEDVDILFPLMHKAAYQEVFDRILDAGFWCYQGDTLQVVYEYVQELKHIRFARKDQIFPNIELIPINESKKAQWFEFKHPQKMRVGRWEFKIPPIEFEILYKELVLGSKKDIQDAKHLRQFFRAVLRDENFKAYRKVIQDETP
jgi:hypothetical protein